MGKLVVLPLMLLLLLTGCAGKQESAVHTDSGAACGVVTDGAPDLTATCGIGDAVAVTPAVTVKWDDRNCGALRSPVKQGGCYYTEDPSVVYLSTGLNTADKAALLAFETKVAKLGMQGEFDDAYPNGCLIIAYWFDTEHGYTPDIRTC